MTKHIYIYQYNVFVHRIEFSFLFSSLAGTAPCFTWSELEASMSLPWMEQIKKYMYLTILESSTRQAFETGKLLLFAIADTCS